MRRMLWIILLLSIGSAAEAQTWDEWFQQKKTQKEYLLKQIAALKVYLGYVRDGYEIGAKGWGIIQGIKEGDLNLHSIFFSSLKDVNPHIKAAPNVAATLLLYSHTVLRIKEARRYISASNDLTPLEKNYLRAVLDRMLGDGLQAIEELMVLTKPDGFELKDDEGWKRINLLHQDMQERYVFTSSFCSEMELLASQRKHERQTIDLMRALTDTSIP